MADNDPNCLNKSVEDDGEGDETIVTMVDVLKEEEAMQENIDAVLGPADDQNCTFKDGYLKRQALYACLTCLPADGSVTAGVCLACSYHCHEDHDLVELYTKRNFSCDCGNSLFPGKPCTLNSEKSAKNEKNSYNQNFRGKYCSCSRPYPDPQDTVEDTMLQCVVCEDWFHTRHLGSSVPNEDDYAEMICGSCTDKLPFLQYYLGQTVVKVSKSNDVNDSSTEVMVTDENEALNSSKTESLNESLSNEKPSENQADTTTEKETLAPKINAETKIEKEICGDVAEQSGEKKKECISDDQQPETTTKDTEMKTVVDEVNPQIKEPKKECLLENLKKLPRGSGATFWPEGYRKLFCTCPSCIEMYTSLKVEFITDEEDTVQAYEEKGKQKRATTPTQYERGMEALNSLDRVQQMEAILNYNEMKSHLSEYLAKFVENKKVVREEDIREFFSGMAARKKQKMDMPYNCR